MTLKLIGAILIVAACAGFGWKLAAMHAREEKSLRQLISVLDFMECELQYRLTPLPELCRQAASESTGPLKEVFLILCQELEDQILPDVGLCMNCAIAKVKNIPKLTCEALQMLCSSLGRFDLQGQLKGLEAVRRSCRNDLEGLCQNKDVRRRSYQTLGLCAGAALAILFV